MKIQRDIPTLRANAKHDGSSRSRSRFARARASIPHQSWVLPFASASLMAVFPMDPLFVRPMFTQFGDLLIPIRRQRGTPIGYCRFAMLFAIGNNEDLDLGSRERRCHNYVLHP